MASSTSLSLTLSLFLSFVLFLSLFGGQAGRGQGESPRAAGGLLEGAADGEQERTVYNIVMIQLGRARLMNHHHHHRVSEVHTYLALPPVR